MGLAPGSHPDGTLSGAGGIAAWGASSAEDFKNGLAGNISGSTNGILDFGAGVFGVFGGILGAIFGTVNNSYIEALPIITNHTAQLSEMRDAVEQLTARGRAIVVESSYMYQPPEGLVTLRFVGIACGAGGAGGQWDLFLAPNQRGGGGGGGGGYSDVPITAAMLPRSNGKYDPIRIDMYLAGNGGATSEAPGGGGGNIIVGANLAEPYVIFQGGIGGVTATLSSDGHGVGGYGMVPGGNGGGGARMVDSVWYPASNGGSSYASERYMGGGGGGAGGATGSASVPAMGGSSVGAGGGTAGQPGASPHRAMAIGAGGGGGSTTSFDAGAGGYPGGGGAGGYGGTGTARIAGAKGGEARLYIYEEMN